MPVRRRHGAAAPSRRSAVVLVLAGLLLGGAAGAARVATTPGEQVATVGLELSAVSPLLDLGPSALSGRPVAVDTDAQILRSDDIVGPVAQASGRSPDQVREDLGATARPLTRVLDLHFRAPDGAAALAGAERAAQTFLEVRQRLVLAPTLDFLEQVASAPLNTTEQADEPLVDRDGDLTQGQLSQEDRAAALALELPTAGTVLQAPRLTEVDDRGEREVPVASGAAAGALLGFGAWWWWRAARRPEAGARTGSAPGRVLARAASSRPPGRRAGRAVAAATLGLAGVVCGVVLAPRLVPPPEADVSLLVTPLPGAAFEDRDGNALVDLGTEAQLALSDDVVGTVASARGVAAADVRQRLSVRLVPNAEVVVVHARGGTGQRSAAVLAERVAEATLDERRSRAAETLARRAELLSTRIARTEVDVERAAQAEDADATEVLSQRLVKLREELKVLVAGAQSPGSVLGTAVVTPTAASAVRYGLPLAGLLAGLAAGWWLPPVLGGLARRASRTAGHQPRRPAVAG